jgi:hypothetical protein
MDVAARSTRTRVALVCAALVLGGTALAADLPTPAACGSNGCTSLATSTLQGLLTLPDALQPAERPRAQPYVLFRVVDVDGAPHEVVYVTRDDEALLGFADGKGWRLVPADDARLLEDAAADRTSYPAPASDTPRAALFEPDGTGGSTAPWPAVAALAGAAAIAVAVVAHTRRSR